MNRTSKRPIEHYIFMTEEKIPEDTITHVLFQKELAVEHK